MVDLFVGFGLKANKDKTKFIVVRGPQAPLTRSLTMYNEIRQGKRKQKEWRREKVTCGQYGVVMT